MRSDPQQKSYRWDATLNTTPKIIWAILLVGCRLLSGFVRPWSELAKQPNNRKTVAHIINPRGNHEITRVVHATDLARHPNHLGSTEKSFLSYNLQLMLCLCVHWVVQNTKQHPFLIHAGSVYAISISVLFLFFSHFSNMTTHCACMAESPKTKLKWPVPSYWWQRRTMWQAVSWCFSWDVLILACPRDISCLVVSWRSQHRLTCWVLYLKAYYRHLT